MVYHKRTNNYGIIIWLSVVTLLGASAYMAYANEISWLVAALICAASVLLGSCFNDYTGMKRALGDERMQKIGMIAASYAWATTLMFFGLMLFVEYGAYSEVTVPRTVGLAMILMVGVWAFFFLYLSRKGDVE